MIQDPTNLYIRAILSQCDLRGKDVLEIGCGKGRITRDLARYAREVVATDPDAEALETARRTNAESNVTFLHTPQNLGDLSNRVFDMVIFTLSLHHIPSSEMSDTLQQAAALVSKDGVMVVVEPADGGAFTEAKERFGAGSGDERVERESALRAMHSLAGWSVGETFYFHTLFKFEDQEDFLDTMLQGHQQQPWTSLDEVRDFLDMHRRNQGIILEAGRRLNVLRRIQEKR